MIAWGMIVWGVALFAQDAPLPGSAEAEADAAIAEFKRNFYRPGSTEDELVIAVRTLGQTVHPKTLAVLVPLIYEDRGPVSTGPVATRIAAALVLANFGKIEGTPEALIKAYGFNTKAASRPVRIQIIQTLGDLKAECASSLIQAVIFDKDPWVARAAIKAAGRVRGMFAIDPLIRRLVVLDSRDGGRPASEAPDPSKAGDPSDSIDRHRKSERQVLSGAIHESLHSITRLNHDCGATWAKWWAQARKDFKVPP
jgi:hypothetical protein